MKQIVKTIISGIIFSFFMSNTSYSLSQNDEANSQEKTIESLRKGTLYIKGKPGASVKVEQLKHEFWFGCAISSGVFAQNSRMSESDIQMYKEKFLENFNSVIFHLII